MGVMLSTCTAPSGRRCRPPMGRAQALDPSAFLINQDRRIIAPNGGAQLGAKLTNLPGRGAIAREKNKAKRVGFGHEVTFFPA